MTDTSLIRLAHAYVCPRAMTTALVLEGRRARRLNRPEIAGIVRENNGDSIMADAIAIRLDLIATLIDIDDDLKHIAARLAPETIGPVLAAVPLRIRDNSLDVDADALVATLVRAVPPAGVA
ncbi:MAG: hypothetical protein EBS23_00845 [Betaproteobacteria bacterium]|nr:hypothetical protein [Betaproteobacteria bacterium]